MDLYVIAKILRFVPIENLIEWGAICKDWYYLCREEIDDRKSLQEIWFKAHLMLHTKYLKFQKKGQLFQQFIHAPLGIVFKIFNYCDPRIRQQVYLFVIQDQTGSSFLMEEFKQQQFAHPIIDFYPFENKLLIRLFRSGKLNNIFEFCLKSLNFVKLNVPERIILNWYNETAHYHMQISQSYDYRLHFFRPKNCTLDNPIRLGSKLMIFQLTDKYLQLQTVDNSIGFRRIFHFDDCDHVWIVETVDLSYILLMHDSKTNTFLFKEITISRHKLQPVYQSDSHSIKLLFLDDSGKFEEHGLIKIHQF